MGYHKERRTYPCCSQYMNARLRLQQYQIALLELCAVNRNVDSVHVPGHVRWSLGGLGPIAYIEKERVRKRREYEQFLRRIAYLKRHHYIELVKEGEQRLVRLTSKAQYEVLRLTFILHMRQQRKRPRGDVFYLIVFDVPEEKAKYRAFFRRLMKASGCTMLQRSVWMAKYNPHPAIDDLLRYLEIERYFEIMEIECKKCSVRLQKRIRQR